MTTNAKYIVAGLCVAAIAALLDPWLMEHFPPKVWVIITTSP